MGAKEIQLGEGHVEGAKSPPIKRFSLAGARFGFQTNGDVFQVSIVQIPSGANLHMSRVPGNGICGAWWKSEGKKNA